jgi:hypothetical protein
VESGIILRDLVTASVVVVEVEDEGSVEDRVTIGRYGKALVWKAVVMRMSRG